MCAVNVIQEGLVGASSISLMCAIIVSLSCASSAGMS